MRTYVQKYKDFIFFSINYTNIFGDRESPLTSHCPVQRIIFQFRIGSILYENCQLLIKCFQQQRINNYTLGEMLIESFFMFDLFCLHRSPSLP
jgi:hypothetical protein